MASAFSGPYALFCLRSLVSAIVFLLSVSPIGLDDHMFVCFVRRVWYKLSSLLPFHDHSFRESKPCGDPCCVCVHFSGQSVVVAIVVSGPTLKFNVTTVLSEDRIRSPRTTVCKGGSSHTEGLHLQSQTYEPESCRNETLHGRASRSFHCSSCLSLDGGATQLCVPKSCSIVVHDKT